MANLYPCILSTLSSPRCHIFPIVASAIWYTHTKFKAVPSVGWLLIQNSVMSHLLSLWGGFNHLDHGYKFLNNCFLLLIHRFKNVARMNCTFFFLVSREAIGKILARGHSRVPVYSGNPKNIIGLLLVSESNQKSNSLFRIFNICGVSLQVCR